MLYTLILQTFGPKTDLTLFRLIISYLHSLFILPEKFGRELAQHFQKRQVWGRIFCSFGVWKLEGKVNPIPEKK